MASRNGRPRPKVAGSASNTWRTGGGSYSGTAGSKSPTGARPKPSVPHDTPKLNTQARAVRKAPKHTSMPANNHAAQKSSRGKGYGSGVM